MKIKNIIKHFKIVCIHKFWVGYYCFKCGLYWRGIKHDMSKFSPVEFFESVKYYTGTSSPIDKCKKEKGYSEAWLHHRGRNDHHYEYWTDNYDKGGVALLMPLNCVIETVCDYLGAGRAYYGNDKFTYTKELIWYLEKIKNKPLMDERNILFILIILNKLSLEYDYSARNISKLKNVLNKKVLKDTYYFTITETQLDSFKKSYLDMVYKRLKIEREEE